MTCDGGRNATVRMVAVVGTVRTVAVVGTVGAVAVVGTVRTVAVVGTVGAVGAAVLVDSGMVMRRGLPRGRARDRRGKRESADKPGSVVDSHSSGTSVTECLVQPTRTPRGRASGPYSVLLQAGFALPPLLPAARCALTAPFHPYRAPIRLPAAVMRRRQKDGRAAVYFLWHFPSARAARGLPGAFAQWSPDFPPRPRTDEATAWPTPTSSVTETRRGMQRRRGGKLSVGGGGRGAGAGSPVQSLLF